MSKEKKTILELTDLKILHICPMAFKDGSRELLIRFKGNSTNSLDSITIKKLEEMFKKKQDEGLFDLILKV